MIEWQDLVLIKCLFYWKFIGKVIGKTIEEEVGTVNKKNS